MGRKRETNLKVNKGQNQYLTPGFIGKIQVTFRKSVLYPDKIFFLISPLNVGICGPAKFGAGMTSSPKLIVVLSIT